MEQIFGLPCLALRNVPEKVVAKLHQVSPSTGGNTSPVAVLDGTRLVSRLHLGAAVRRAILAQQQQQQQQQKNATSGAAAAAAVSTDEALKIDARPVSPARLQSPTRLSPSRRRAQSEEAQLHRPAQTLSGVTVASKAAATIAQQQQQKNQQQQSQQQPARIASQLVFYLSPSRSGAVKNFVLAPVDGGAEGTNSNNNSAVVVHSSVVIVFDADILPSEAWKWAKTAGCIEHVVSLDTLKTTVDVDRVAQIYGLDVAAVHASETTTPFAGGTTGSNSGMPARASVRDTQWLERQIVSKIATAGL